MPTSLDIVRILTMFPGNARQPDQRIHGESTFARQPPLIFDEGAGYPGRDSSSATPGFRLTSRWHVGRYRKEGSRSCNPSLISRALSPSRPDIGAVAAAGCGFHAPHGAGSSVNILEVRSLSRQLLCLEEDPQCDRHFTEQKGGFELLPFRPSRFFETSSNAVNAANLMMIRWSAKERSPPQCIDCVREIMANGVLRYSDAADIELAGTL